MGHVGIDWTQVVARIENAVPLALASDVPAELAAFVSDKTYTQLFIQAFDAPQVTPARIAMAIASYERVLISDDAPVDDFPNGFTQQEIMGSTLFDSKARCAFCHSAPLFTDHSFRNIGLRPPFEDLGLGAVTGDPADDGKFKMPSLRNVELRAPFFHNGGKSTLEEVVEFYDVGGEFHAGQDPDIQPLNLTQAEKDALVAYLKTFTDPRVRDGLPPFDRPTLYSETAKVPALYGAPTPGFSGSVPASIAVEPPFLTNPSLTVGLKNGLGGALGVLVLGAAAEPAGLPVAGITLHLALAPAPVVYSVGSLGGVGPGNGFRSEVFGLSLGPAAVGQSVFGQWIVVELAPGPSLAASDAFALTFF